MKLTLTHKVHLVGNIWAYTFEPAEAINWIAGQFIRVELPHDHPDAEGTKRFFTISSPPHQGTIQITTRLTSSTFKQALHRLKPGQAINLLDRPAGDFTWRDWRGPTVFVAQGIGITPFYSMLADRIHRGLPITTSLFWTNFTSGVPFEHEFRTWSKDSHGSFQVALSTEPYTPARLAELMPKLSSSLIYVSGPTSLITLLGPPVNLPISQLRQDNFPNYAQSDY